jgi:pyroglutamyl-peptidase
MGNCILVTGFEPYGGRGLNPASEVARALDGRRFGGLPVAARLLPVSFAQIRARADALLDALDPAAVVSLGLWPGEPAIRIERFGVNLADFEIADNEGALIADTPIAGNGAAALAATLPVRRIEAALLEAGIPARLSATAGTFLCNACLFTFLDALAARGRAVPCGFIHLPYLPQQVAWMLTERRREARLELHQRADLASMDLATVTRAVEIALGIVGETARAAA